MMRKRLENHKYCNCYVEMDNFENPEIIKFISYITEVIHCVRLVKNGNWYIKCTGTYSQTTRKQIGYFLKEYFPMLNYFNIKEIAGENKYIVLHNDNTFEIVSKERCIEITQNETEVNKNEK